MTSSEDMVRETIVQQMGLSPAAVTLSARLVEDLNFSPLDMVPFIMQVEEQAQVTIPDADIQSFKDLWRRRQVRRRPHGRELVSNRLQRRAT